MELIGNILPAIKESTLDSSEFWARVKGRLDPFLCFYEMIDKLTSMMIL